MNSMLRPPLPEAESPVEISGPEPYTPLRGRAFPASVAAVVLILGLFEVHGSSLGIYATGVGATEAEAGVLVGPTRSIRSDEWYVRTPWVLRQAELGFPSTAAGGVGTHDVAVLSDLPTASWELMLRPHTAWYLIFGVEKAFALEWWSFAAVQLLGVFWLLLVLTKRPLIATLCALMLTLSPATQWWWAPGTFTTIGYGSAATACLVIAHRTTTRRRQVVLSVLAGYLIAVFLTTLYLPWQIGTALVVGPVGAAALLPSILDHEQRPAAIRRLLAVGGISLVVAAGLFGTFVISHRATMRTIASTVYPGNEAAQRGGQVKLPVFWGATFDYFASRKPSALVNGTNQSENSSALVLVFPVAMASLLLAGAGKFRGHPAALPLVGCMVGAAILASWMLLPIPGSIGRLALLTRAPPSRLFLPLGLASVVALALFVHYQQTARPVLARWMVFSSAGAFAVAQGWGAWVYKVDGQQIGFGLAIIFVGIVTSGFILTMGRRPAIGLGVLALFLLWQASMIQPLQRGLDPITASPLRRAVDAARSQDEDAGWVAFAADAVVKGTLTASGANNISAVSPYPDLSAWAMLDPESDDANAWNRYAHVSFNPGTPGQAPAFQLIGPDNLAVTIDPCSPIFDRLGVGFMVSQGFELGTCVRPLARVPHGEGFVVIYERQGKNDRTTLAQASR